MLVPARKSGSQGMLRAKRLLCAGWAKLLGHDGLRGRGLRQSTALIWLAGQLQLQEISIRRLAEVGRADEQLPQICDDAIRVAKRLTSDHVYVAIAAGLLGHEKRGVTTPQNLADLLSVAQEWLQEGSPDAALLP